jgi:hypothetical protein
MKITLPVGAAAMAASSRWVTPVAGTTRATTASRAKVVFVAFQELVLVLRPRPRSPPPFEYEYEDRPDALRVPTLFEVGTEEEDEWTTDWQSVVFMVAYPTGGVLSCIVRFV